MKIALKYRLLDLLSNLWARAVCLACGHRWHYTVVFADGSRRKACAFCPATKKLPTLRSLG